ncbi:protein ENHANCED DISEASE RESISTANCE 4-like [Durio zibethinus]|uniref:Protein ENHANCED DISEASE RESISTANCE 4-like n=1 Tax=Durio zibethinus TaxID=66656 RepID=A0A6P5ZYA3_DURZI|nr:protein ENHANCED DISEASE RESISTANCE 4-like [Durio zibethinus]
MAASTKVRLVLCPKCENLLPELADYSVYQCGGCGAVLRAKIRSHEADAFSETLEEDRLGRVSTKSQISSDKEIVDSSDASDADVKSSAHSLRCDQRDPEKNDVECTDGNRNESKVDSEKWSVENANDSRNKDEILISIATEQEDLDSNFEYTGGSQRQGQMSDWQTGKQEEMEGFQQIPRGLVEGVRFSTSNNPDEGPSNHHLDSSYGCSESSRNRIDQDGSSRIHLEQDRAELLRKLDELKEQLNRSCDVVDKPKEKVPLDGMVVPPESYGGADTWFPNGSSGSRKPSMPFYGPDKHAAGAGPSYFNHLRDPFSYPVGHDVSRHGLYPPMHNPNHIPAYGDHFGSQMLGRAPHQLPGEYQQQPPHPYFSGQYSESNHDPFMPYPQSSFLHQASCSCFHCYEKHLRVPAPVPPGTFGNKRFPDVPSNPMYQIENPGTFGSHFCSSRTTMPPPLNVRGTQVHARWPSDINSEMGAFVRCRPQRVVLASGGRRLRPIAGGAPFIMCYNCFELLQMPRKVQLMVKNEHKLRCGACSTVINFSVINKRLVLHNHVETKGISLEVDDTSNEVVNDSSSHFRGRVNRIAANFSSDDYDHSGYDFQSMDREPVVLSTGQALNSVRPQEMHSFHSSSPSISEDENSPDVLIASREEVNSVQQPIKSTLSPPTAGSPLQEHFDYSSNNHAVNRFGKGNRSSRSDQEKVVSNKATTRQNSLKEASLPTEMEVSFNEYSNTGISQDSGDATREDDQPKMAKGGESFFANIIKKSFKDFSRSNQTEECGKSNISVNGHPLPERVVKKAQKKAGPIHPGHYWYDFRAGFWGVLGGPCLGIIPPFIEEFNHLMPENCAGGTTGVFVNGRELHQKDLDLLANRGLPTDRDRSYRIEISGRVLDEDNGEELDSLGKLAPTVEKAKHGFGMKVPRAAA